VARGEDIDPLTVGKIIEMNRSRMKSKKLRSAIDAELEEKIIHFSGKYGVVATITLNGRLAAGTICYGVGNHCYADIISHDQDYNEYSIGRVCIYLFISALIDRGFRFFHMGSGEYGYKERMLGRKQDVYFMSIFRSRIDKQIGLIRHARKHKYIKMARDLVKYRYLWRLRENFLKK
jgi:CelD/BcsL family acetyltransferase involved in cellulose biosynthesis